MLGFPLYSSWLLEAGILLCGEKYISGVLFIPVGNLGSLHTSHLALHERHRHEYINNQVRMSFSVSCCPFAPGAAGVKALAQGPSRDMLPLPAKGIQTHNH